MRKIPVAIVALSLLLAACGVDTTGLSPKSSKQPKGNPAALVTVTEYGDFQCPACKTAHEFITKPLLQKYGDKIRFEFKQFPLRTIHAYALEAAEASECAADQGKFWEFVDIAYARQADLSSSALRDFAKVLGLDADLFDRCVRSGIKEGTTRSDEADGNALDVQGTPSYFVNGQRVASNTYQALSDAVEQALRQVEKGPL